MGAALAVRLALAGLLNVEALTLIRPAFSDVPSPPNLAPLQYVGRLMQEHSHASQSIFEQSETYASAREASPDSARSLLAQFSAPYALARAARLVHAPHNVAYPSHRQLEHLFVDAVVVGAPADALHPIELAHEWASTLPSARFLELPPRFKSPELNLRELRSIVSRRVSAF